MALAPRTALSADQPAAVGPGSTARLLFLSARPEQWTKNALIFAGLVFGHRLTDPAAVVRSLEAFAIFCVLSSSVYLFNDVTDRERDREHPVKRFRPVASGHLPVRSAVVGSAVGILAGLAGAAAFGPAMTLVAGAYAALLLTYSLALKHLVILDVFTIAAGFVLRAVAGGLAVGVPISQWLLLCTTLLALFLALSKRRHELVVLGEDAVSHRHILSEYSPYLLDQMISVVTAASLVAYAAYTASSDTAVQLGTGRLSLTVPFVLYGIFRYLYLVHQKHTGGNPSELLVGDRPLLVSVALWIATVIVLLYTPLGH